MLLFLSFLLLLLYFNSHKYFHVHVVLHIRAGEALVIIGREHALIPVYVQAPRKWRLDAYKSPNRGVRKALCAPAQRVGVIYIGIDETKNTMDKKEETKYAIHLSNLKEWLFIKIRKRNRRREDARR